MRQKILHVAWFAKKHQPKFDIKYIHCRVLVNALCCVKVRIFIAK